VKRGGLAPGGSHIPLRTGLARVRHGILSPRKRGLLFWLVTVLLGLVLPTPVAAAVVVARLRRPPRKGPDEDLPKAA
jgi:hypothetical protein